MPLTENSGQVFLPVGFNRTRNLRFGSYTNISNAYDCFFETRPLMSVLTTISTPRLISSGGGIKLATGVVFKLFWIFFFFFFFFLGGGGGGQFYTYK